MLLACGTGPGPRLIDLPTTTFTGDCLGVGFEGRLDGSPDDPRVAWLEPGGRRLVWPVGFVARFTPKLGILDRDGQLVIEEGDAVSGVCFMGTADAPDSVVMIEGLLVPRGSV